MVCLNMLLLLGVIVGIAYVILLLLARLSCRDLNDEDVDTWGLLGAFCPKCGNQLKIERKVSLVDNRPFDPQTGGRLEGEVIESVGIYCFKCDAAGQHYNRKLRIRKQKPKRDSSSGGAFLESE